MSGTNSSCLTRSDAAMIRRREIELVVSHKITAEFQSLSTSRCFTLALASFAGTRVSLAKALNPHGNPMNRLVKLSFIAAAVIAIPASMFMLLSPRQGALSPNLAGDKSSTPNHGSARPSVDESSAIRTDKPLSGAAQSASDKVKLGDEFYGANNQELVDWLNRRGFPSKEVLQNGARKFYPNLNTVVGYPTDSVVYAEHLARSDPNRRDEAISHLTGAAVSGSTYALEALGRVYEDGPNRSIVEAEAYFKAAEYMGDWSIGLTPRKWTLTHEQNLVSSILAQQIRARINRTRQQAGLPPLQPDVKPGLDDFAKAMMAEYGSVSR